MKKEVYKHFKMLSALKDVITNFWLNGFDESVAILTIKHNKLIKKLKEALPEEDKESLEEVEVTDYSKIDSFHIGDAKLSNLQRLYATIRMNLAYLSSLDMDLNKELEEKIKEINKTKEELRIKEDNLEHSQKILGMLLHPKEGLPEYTRSKIMAGIKEEHRNMEKNTNPDTKSQGGNKPEKDTAQTE